MRRSGGNVNTGGLRQGYAGGGAIAAAFAWNEHRQDLLDKFKACLLREIRPKFAEPLIFDGSYVTDKEQPDDIDVVLDLQAASEAHARDGLMFMHHEQKRLMAAYRVHFWVNVRGIGQSNFSDYVSVFRA